MRTISIRLIAALSLVVGFAACGGDDGDDGTMPIDAPVTVIDAPVTPIDAPAANNALGQVCTLNPDNCPSGNTCTAIGGVGSQTNGYCSPACTETNGACAAGYTGPAGGMPVCAVTEGGATDPTLCAIICTGDPQCPTGLTCQAVPGAGVSICAAPV